VANDLADATVTALDHAGGDDEWGLTTFGLAAPTRQSAIILQLLGSRIARKISLPSLRLERYASPNIRARIKARNLEERRVVALAQSLHVSAMACTYACPAAAADAR
jgi:hypothetical protein